MHHEPTPAEICTMCHLSSECSNCCNKCNKRFCTGGEQICMQGEKEQVTRYAAWMIIVRENIHYKRLYRIKKNGIHRKQLTLF